MSLIPRPLRDGRPARPGPGTAPALRLGERTRIDAGPGAERAERWLRSAVGAATGLPLPPGAAPDEAASPGGADGGRVAFVVLRVDDEVAVDLGPEGYRYEAAGDRVRITGGGPAGVFWGAQTLRRRLGPDAFRRAPVRERPWAVPVERTGDAPRFAWRGLMLDVARHFMPKDGILRYIDLMTAHKLNVLHLHLTDDQGWRMEIRRHPRLTETGAWRARTRAGLGKEGASAWDERPHGGFYTQDDLREIVAYAAERFVSVVPEIDIPGHSQAAIAAYPELGNADVTGAGALEVWTAWGISPNVLAPTEAVARFYENVLTEVLEVFPASAARFSEFVHIGGDECVKDQWRASPTARERIRELGLEDENGLQAWFVRHFGTWLTERGRRLIGWDEVLDGGLAPGAAVSSWQGYARGIEGARAGHDVVMCPEQHVYLNWRQSGGPDEPIPVLHVRTLEDVYRFEPVPPELDPDDAARIIGTQANMWTETTDSARAVDYHVFPRLAAFSEVAWSDLPPPAERDFADFERRMTEHYAVLDALGVEYRPPAGPHPWQRRPGVLGRPIEGPPPIV